MASNYSFDVVSDFDRQELINVVDQLKREVIQRYDLKDTNTEINLGENELIIITASDLSLQSIEVVLRQKTTKRNLSLKIFDFQPSQTISGNKVKQVILLRKGLSKEIAKKLSKSIRDQLKKVNVSIQGDALRISSKNKDDLQSAMNFLRSQEESLEIPLQYENFR